MIKTGSTIKLSDRKEMSEDKFYKTCSLYGQEGHKCGGKITWEHTLIYGGKKIQDPWAIIPLCEKGHAVNNYQDAGTMNKEMNIWVALNRATDDQLILISKAENYIHKRKYLNSIYGEYTHKTPPPVKEIKESKNYIPIEVTERKEENKNWVPLDDHHYGLLLELRKKNKELLGLNYSPFQMLDILIENSVEDLLGTEKENFSTGSRELLV